MLSYDTERHAKELFAKLVRECHLNSMTDPSETEILELGRSAVRLADIFSRVTSQLSGVSPMAELHRPSCQLTFEELFLEWQQRGLKVWERKEKKKLNSRFRRYIFPSLGPRLATEIQPAEIVATLRNVEDAGYLASAHMLLSELKRLFRFAIAAGYLRNNPTTEVQTALHRRRIQRRATILLPRKIGELLRASDAYRGKTVSKYFIRLLPLVFLRRSE